MSRVRMGINRRWYELAVPRSGFDSLVFRVAHRLLSPGSGEMARLRGYLRLKAWRRCRTTRERLRVLGFALKLPARAARGSWRAVKVHGEVARREQVSRPQQF